MFEPLSVILDDVDTATDGNFSALKVPIGFCDETKRLVLLTSNIEFCVDERVYEPHFHELAFQIDVFYTERIAETFSSQTREECARYIPYAIRPHVMSIVSDSYTRLIREISPENIYRVMKTTAAIEKTIKKHDLLTTTIKNEGYSVKKAGTDMFGRRFWLMGR